MSASRKQKTALEQKHQAHTHAPKGVAPKPIESKKEADAPGDTKNTVNASEVNQSTPNDNQHPKYQEFCILDDGHFGTIGLAKEIGTRNVYAIKKFKTSARQDPENELKIWRDVSNIEGVVPLEGVTDIQQRGYHPKAGLMEIYEFKSLENWLQQVETPTPIPQTLAWATSLAKTLEQVHAKHIRHGDLAARNLLLTAEKPGAPLTIKLADFGLSRYLLPPAPDSSPAVVEKYQIENLERTSVDLQCFGHVLLQILAHDLHIYKDFLPHHNQKETATRFPWMFSFALNLFTNPSSTTIQVAAESLQEASKAFSNVPSFPRQLTEESNAIVTEIVSTRFFNKLKSYGFLFAKMEVTDANRIKKLVREGVKALIGANIHLLDDEREVLDERHVSQCISSHPGWNNKFTPEHIKKLTLLIKGKKERVTAFNLLCMFVWLGDPQLKVNEAMPAPEAIDFIYHMVNKGKIVGDNFYGFISKKQADQSKVTLIFRLNDGFILNKKPGVMPLFRNMIVSDKRDNDCTHVMLFRYDLHDPFESMVKQEIISSNENSVTIACELNTSVLVTNAMANQADIDFYNNSGAHLPRFDAGDEKNENGPAVKKVTEESKKPISNSRSLTLFAAAPAAQAPVHQNTPNSVSANRNINIFPAAQRAQSREGIKLENPINKQNNGRRHSCLS